MVVAVGVSVPELPVMVTVEVLAGAVMLAENVSTQLPLPTIGVVQPEKLTPLGIPVKLLIVTVPLNPPLSVTVIVSLAVPLWAIDKFAGDTESEKLPVSEGSMVSVIVVVAGVNEPELPVMVIVAVPRGAVVLAVKVNALDPVAGLVPKVTVTPLGKPDAVSVTLPVNPPASIIEIVSEPLPPWAMVSAAAEELSVKLGEEDPPSGNWMLSSSDCFNELGGVAS